MQTKVYSLKRADGKIFTIGDKFNWKGNTGKAIVCGKVSRKSMRICGFEKYDNGWYVLYMPTYSNGVVEKKNPWRACDLNSAILIK